MKIAELTEALVKVSEKAGNVARAIRSEDALFELLVEEKTGDSKNKRFIQDFKTLGDVLVQEMVRHDLGKEFPGITEHIYGEESNTFTNTLGETVTVEIKTNKEETSEILGKVLDGNGKAASLLTSEIYTEAKTSLDSKLASVKDLDIPVSDVAIWIDPIDSTAQYILGRDSKQEEMGVYSVGLQCVVVLIGAYNRKTGAPIVGVINQPFAEQDADLKRWSGRYSWGLCYDSNILNHISTPECAVSPSKKARSSNVIVMSTSENKDVQKKLAEEFTICYAAGAGYKILCVVDGFVDAYFLTQGTTFKWDTCGPHAVLESEGGGIVDCQKSIAVLKENLGATDETLQDLIKTCSLKYHESDSPDLPSDQTWSNSGGLIAYRDSKMLLQILKSLV